MNRLGIGASLALLLLGTIGLGCDDEAPAEESAPSAWQESCERSCEHEEACYFEPDATAAEKQALIDDCVFDCTDSLDASACPAEEIQGCIDCGTAVSCELATDGITCWDSCRCLWD